MDERQRQNLEKHGTTRPREPDFVLKATEVLSEDDLVAWVRKELRFGAEGDIGEIVAALRGILTRHGEVWIFTEVRLTRPPDFRPGGGTITWGRFFVAEPPGEASVRGRVSGGDGE